MEKYREIVADCCDYRKWIGQMIVEYPELFPKTIGLGYTLHDERVSGKLEAVRLQRICLKVSGPEGKKQVFTIAPSGVMPYCVGYTDEVEKALFLRRFYVPFWALTYLFGRDNDYWYRMEQQFGRYNLVQTVVILSFISRRTPFMGQKEYHWLCFGSRTQIVRKSGALRFGLCSSTRTSHQ
jgi:hypothetical protein